MPKCPRHSRKVSKTRCFNDNDVVVHRTPGKCPKHSRKKSKSRCFDDNDNEIIFTPPGSPSPSPIHPGNIGLQASPPRNLGQARGIYSIPPYMLNRIKGFVGPEPTRYMTPQTFAMLNQKVPSIGRMMFDFLYIDGEPRFKKGYLKYTYAEDSSVTTNKYENAVVESFKDYVRQIYRLNKLKPIPLTPKEEGICKDKLYQMVILFSMGTPSRKNTLLYLEDTTGRVNPKKNFKYR